MSEENSSALRKGYCIFIHTVFQGRVPSVHEFEPDADNNERDKICVFATKLEAQREIADFMMTRLREFMDGERDFEDAIETEEYVVEVEVQSDGSVIDEYGNHFRPESYL
jgi:hypothetical protein